MKRIRGDAGCRPPQAPTVPPRTSRIMGQHHLRPLENVFLERERRDPGAEVGGDGHTFLDRNQAPVRAAGRRAAERHP